jgi:hypothetical protein
VNASSPRVARADLLRTPIGAFLGMRKERQRARIRA